MPWERINLNSNWAIHICLFALLHQEPEQDHLMWKADHSFVYPSHSVLHHLYTRCTAITLPPYTVNQFMMNFNKWKFLPAKIDWQHNSFVPSSSTDAILKQLLCLVDIIWGADCYCCLVLSTCTNWTHAFQLNIETLSAGIKYRALLVELPSYNAWNGICETWF